MAANDQRDSPSDVPQTNIRQLEKMVPSKDLSEVALYSYNSLCAYGLGKLYGETEFDRDLVVGWARNIARHHGLSTTATETMLTMATGEVSLDNADPFVDVITNDPLICQHGAIVLTKDLLAMVLKEGCYDARMRTVIKYLSLLLRVDWQAMEEFEDLAVSTLDDEDHQPTPEELSEEKSKKKTRKIKSYLLIGAAAIGGGTLLGLTGGLAAPLIAAGAGALIGGTGAAALGSVAGVAIIGSLFGAAGVGLGGYKMKKRVGGVEEFEFEPLGDTRQLHITIGVSGWITEKIPDMKLAWLGLANSKEQYVLKYETKYMMELGKALTYLMDIAIKAATQQALQYTVLSGLLTAVAWPAALLSVSSIIDNPWSVCTHRAVNVGKQLADVLLTRQQGKRPVTLIGFSLGARVIFYCLQEMSRRKNCEGIVEDVIMLGTPVTGNPKEWEPLARVVAGRIVNGYCRGDWLLKFLYRTASVQFSIAGLKPIAWQDRRMHNIDLSDVIQGHLDYMHKIDDILAVVGIKTKDHPLVGRPAESLRDWVKINKSSSVQDNLKAPESSLSSQQDDRSSGPESSSGSGSLVNLDSEAGSLVNLDKELESDTMIISGSLINLDVDLNLEETRGFSPENDMSGFASSSGSGSLVNLQVDSASVDRISTAQVSDVGNKLLVGGVETNSSHVTDKMVLTQAKECGQHANQDTGRLSQTVNMTSPGCARINDSSQTRSQYTNLENCSDVSDNLLYNNNVEDEHHRSIASHEMHQDAGKKPQNELPNETSLLRGKSGDLGEQVMLGSALLDGTNSSVSSVVTTPDSGIVADDP